MKPDDANRDHPAVRFENVSVVLGGIPIVESVSARAPMGSSTAIIGPNGAGKTTLLMALLGQAPYMGTIRLRCPRAGDESRIGYVPQFLDFDRGAPLTVMDFMVMGRQRSPLWLGTRARHRSKTLELLAAVKADHLADRLLGALSGGELKRVLLALALERDPDLLVLDEPGAGVDIRGELLICELLDQLREERGFTLLMVTHDLAMVTAHASHVICLNRRVTGEGAVKDVLRPDILAATFGIHAGLLEACHHD
jgi:zinc transport system ATP-binding protein